MGDAGSVKPTFPSKKYRADYCRNAVEKGYLTDDEHQQILTWLMYNPGWKDAPVLHKHTFFPNQQGKHGLCGLVDGICTNISYTKWYNDEEAYLRNQRSDAFRNAIRPSREKFLEEGRYPSNYEAHHANDGGFKAITDAFEADHRVPTPTPTEGGGGWDFDIDTAAKFREYHDGQVVWQALPPNEHKTKHQMAR